MAALQTPARARVSSWPQKDLAIAASRRKVASSARHTTRQALERPSRELSNDYWFSSFQASNVAQSTPALRGASLILLYYQPQAQNNVRRYANSGSLDQRALRYILRTCKIQPPARQLSA